MSGAPPSLPPPDGEKRRPRFVPARVFWRVYLHGVLLLVLVALAVGFVGAALRHTPAGGGRHPERFAEYAATRVADLRGHPVALARELARVRETFGVEISVYEGPFLVASNVDPPLPPLRSRACRSAT